jgi:hypothetical protein
VAREGREFGLGHNFRVFGGSLDKRTNVSSLETLVLLYPGTYGRTTQIIKQKGNPMSTIRFAE